MATNWGDFEPVDSAAPRAAAAKPGKTDWSQFTPVKPDDSSDLGRGAKEAFQQLPQLGYGLLAGAGAAAESAFGEGGIATGIKKAGVAGYQAWGDKIATNAKESDAWDYSYDQAKQGNFGALVDWLQHGIGYVGGQGIQMLATAGIGAVGGKFIAATAAKQVAERMVAKSAAEIAATEAGAKLTAAELAEAATANVAGKFAAIGQNTAVGAMGFGQEGGEIFGDLSKRSVDEGRSLSGAEVGKAFAASLAAGALEFVGDKIGLDVILGKSSLLKPAEGMLGIRGRLARGGLAAVASAPIEAGTEYLQTGLENYGKGEEANILPFNQSEKAQKDAINSAALGALGGTVIGGAGGMLHGAKTAVATPLPAEAPAQPLAIGNTPDPYISFPDGTVGKRADVDRYVASLPEDQRPAARAALFGINPQPQQPNPIAKIAASQSVDEAIAAATEAVTQPLELPAVDESALSPFMRRAPGVTWERDLAGISLDADLAGQLAQREAELDAIGGTAGESRAEFDARQAALQRAAAVEAPSAMELALRRAARKAAPEPAPQAAPVAPPEPRIVTRTPDMQPTSQAKAQAQADAMGGEVARVQNQSGKFAYVALPASQKEIQPQDLLTGDGKPYGSLIAAKVRARKEGADVVAVTGGWVVRSKPAAAPQTETAPNVGIPDPAVPAPTTSDRGGPADNGRGVVADGRLDAEPAPALPGGTAPAAGKAVDAGLEGRADDAAVAPQAFKVDTKPDGSVTVLGDPAAIRAAVPGIPGIAGARGVSYGKSKAEAVAAALGAPDQPAVPTQKPVKVYKTRPAAEAAKSGNTQRLRKVQGGYILRDASDAELAAAEKAGRRLSRKHSIDPEKDSLLTAIAKLGGLAMKEKSDTIGEGNKLTAGGHVFTTTGKAIDEMARRLGEEENFIPQDEMRDGGVRWLRDAIKDEYGGHRKYFSERGTDWMAEAMAERESRYDDSPDDDPLTNEARYDDSLLELTAEDLEESGYIGATPAVQEASEAMLVEAESLGIDTDWLKQHADSQTTGLSDDEYHARLQEDIRQAIASTRTDAGRADPSAARASDRGDGEPAGDKSQESSREDLTLTAQTHEDLRAKADREDAQTKAEAAKKDADQARLRKDAEARDLKARADATVDDFELGQDAGRQMSGMGDMFDQPTQSAAPSATTDALPEQDSALVDPFKLDKQELNRELDKIVAAGDAPDLIRAMMVLRRRYEKATGKKSEPPAGSRWLPLSPESSQGNAPAAEAATILDAAGVTGKERLEALKDVKAGTVTADELAAAYPAKDAAAAPKKATSENTSDDANSDKEALAKSTAQASARRQEQDAIIQLRKRKSVLDSLLRCLG